MARPTTSHTRARRAAFGRGVRALHVSVLFLALMTVSGPAWSFWTQAGVTAAGTGSGTTGTLSAPTAVTASGPAGGNSVSVAWSAPVAGVAPAGYFVVRTNTATSSAVAACGTSATSLVTTTSCTDGAVPDGTYRYTVIAVRSGWTATSIDSNAVTILLSIATTTTLGSSANPSLVGQSVTFTATVTAPSGTPTGAVVFRDGGSPITCSGGSQTLSSGTATCVVSYAAAGSHGVTAAYAGSTPYNASASSALSQGVNQQSQTVAITSTAPTSATVAGSTYTVTATATSGLAVAFSSSTTAVCTVSGSTVTFVGGGTCTVLADQAGNAAYAAATQKPQSFSVAKASQTITFTSTAPTNTGTGSTYGVSATATSGLAVAFTSGTPSVCTVSGSTVTAVSVGTCTVFANQAGNAAYNAAAQAQQSYTVAKASQTISFTSTAPTSATMGDAAYSVTATATSGLAVTFSSATPAVCTVTGSTVTYVAAGTCTVNADQAGNANFNAAPRVTQNFLVAAAPSAPTNLSVSGTTTSGTATWTATAGYTYQCQNTNGNSAPDAGGWVGCSPGYVFAPKSGQQTFWVRGLRGAIVTDTASIGFKP